MFGWAAQREIVEANPVRDTPKPARERARDRVHTDDELVSVWKATDTLTGTTRAMARVLILTGQRIGSVEAMRWSDVDLKAATWTIPAEHMKMDRDHVVPLAPIVVDLIRELPRDGEFVFAGRSGEKRNGRSKFRNAWRTASGISDWTPHDLRRTMATGLQRLGVRLEVVEAILAHESGSRRGVVGIYQRHHWTDEKRNALNAWADHVLRLVGIVEADNVVPLLA
jgi:integrase